MTKYMFLYHHPSDLDRNPSPEEMQAMMGAWQAWHTEFKANILDMGDGLKPSGKVLHPDDSVTDGPFAEAKEVVAGYSVVQAESYEHALTVARMCPVRHIPGARVEVRELFGH